MTFRPSDLPATHVFKVGPDGQIHAIGAIGFETACNSQSGWAGKA